MKMIEIYANEAFAISNHISFATRQVTDTREGILRDQFSTGHLSIKKLYQSAKPIEILL